MNFEELKGEILKAIEANNTELLEKSVPALVKETIKPLQSTVDNKLQKAISRSQGDVSVESKQRVDDMVRAIFSGRQSAARELSDNAVQKFTGQGYLVPEDYAKQIFTLVDQYGVARRNCYPYTMGTDTANLPKLLTGLTMTWIGSTAHTNAGWDSGTRKPTTSPTVGRVQLTVKDIAGVVPLDKNLLTDTNTNLSDLLLVLVAIALAKAEDTALFTGVAYSAETVGGVLDAATALNGSGTGFADCTIDDLLDMQAEISSAALVNAKYFMNPSVKAHFRKKGLSQGWAGRIKMEDALGYPIEETNALPAMSATAADTEFVVFGNLQNVYLGNRSNLAVDMATEANIYDASGTLLHALFQDNMVGMRAVSREDIKIMQDDAFCALKTQASS